jgi:hypothetical protein
MVCQKNKIKRRRNVLSFVKIDEFLIVLYLRCLFERLGTEPIETGLLQPQSFLKYRDILDTELSRGFLQHRPGVSDL